MVEKASWAIGGVGGAFWFQVALLVMETVVIDIKDEVVLTLLMIMFLGSIMHEEDSDWCIVPATPCQPHVPASTHKPDY